MFKKTHRWLLCWGRRWRWSPWSCTRHGLHYSSSTFAPRSQTPTRQAGRPPRTAAASWWGRDGQQRLKTTRGSGRVRGANDGRSGRARTELERLPRWVSSWRRCFLQLQRHFIHSGSEEATAPTTGAPNTGENTALTSSLWRRRCVSSPGLRGQTHGENATEQHFEKPVKNFFLSL